MTTIRKILKAVSVILISSIPFLGIAQGVRPEANKPFIVIIDPGHGGFDPGAHGRYSTEKEIALGISLKTGKLIDQIPGVKVIYTRTTDMVPGHKTNKTDGLHYRADFANKMGGNVFISIHCNAAANESAKGTEVYVWDLRKNKLKSQTLKNNAPLLNDPQYQAMIDSSGSAINAIFWNSVRRSYMKQSLILAADVEDQFAKINRINRDVKQRSWEGIWVLHATAMPSILIETGFITNPEEEDYLNNDQDELAACIYNAFVNYLAGLKGVTNKELLAGVNPVRNASATAYPAFHYKIQLFASSKKINTNSRKLSKLDDGVDRKPIKVDNKRMYRYLLGNYKTYQEAANKLGRVKLMGYRNAFIVTYKNNKRLAN